MEQIAVVARLKSGMEPRAARLIAAGPPFDPSEVGLSRHAVYLAADEVVFVFEGPQVEWILDEMVDRPFQWQLSEAFDTWRPLVDGQPHVARAAYVWTREADSRDIASP